MESKIIAAVKYHSQCAEEFYVIVKSMEDEGTKWQTIKLMYTMFYSALFSKRKFEIDLIIIQMANKKVAFITEVEKLYDTHVLLKQILIKINIHTVPLLKTRAGCKILGREILGDLKVLAAQILVMDNGDIENLHTVSKYLCIVNKNLNNIITIN